MGWEGLGRGGDTVALEVRQGYPLARGLDGTKRAHNLKGTMVDL